jgi:hypothetical protein
MDHTVESFDSPLLADVAFENDGTLKKTGKQNVKFRYAKRLGFRARPKRDSEGNPMKDADGNPIFLIDPKTGIPFKDAHEEVVEMIRVETRGDTTIKDEIANDLSKRQFAREYKAFRQGKFAEGNPIEEFDFLQPSTILELRMNGIQVIQQVAEMTDLECDMIRDQSGYEIRDIAAQWVRISSPQGQSGKADRLEVEVEKLKRQLADAMAAGSKRGRSRSVEAAESVEESPVEVAEPTLELTPEQSAKGPQGRRKRLVS